MPNFLVHSDKTDVGRVRSANEDFHLIPDVPNHHCYIVCDGMGGHVGGAAASKMAASVFAGSLTSLLSQGERVSKAMDLAIRECNAAVYNRTLEEPELKGMGTTIVAVVVDTRGEVYVGHVGDSRIYRFRGGQLQQVTRDDSYVQDLIDRGELREEDREKHPERSRITKAIGIDGVVEPTVRNLGAWQPGDRILLCSDGLTGVVEDEALAKEAQTERFEAVEKLMGKALMAGAPDNVTLILVEAEGTNFPQPPVVTGKGVASFLTRTDWFAPNWAWLVSGGLSLFSLLVFMGPAMLDAIWPAESGSGENGGGGVRYVCLDEGACNYFDQDTVFHNARGGGACRYDLNPCLVCEGDSVVPGDSCIQLNSTWTEVLAGDLAQGSWVYFEATDGEGAPYRWVPDTDLEIQSMEVLWSLSIHDRKIVRLQPAPANQNEANSPSSETDEAREEAPKPSPSVSSESKKSTTLIKPRPKTESKPASLLMTQNRVPGVRLRGFGEAAKLWNSQSLAPLSEGKLRWREESKEKQKLSDVHGGHVFELQQGVPDTNLVVFSRSRRGSVSQFDFSIPFSAVEDFEFIRYDEKSYFGLIEMASASPFMLIPGRGAVDLKIVIGSTSDFDFVLYEDVKAKPVVLAVESRTKRPGVNLKKCPVSREMVALESTWSLSGVRTWVFVHNRTGQWVSGWTGEAPFWEGQRLKDPSLSQQTLALDEEHSTFLSLDEEQWRISHKGNSLDLDLKTLEESGELRHVSWDEETGVLVMVFDKCVYTGKVETP